jgi:hypothetical protein
LPKGCRGPGRLGPQQKGRPLPVGANCNISILNNRIEDCGCALLLHTVFPDDAQHPNRLRGITRRENRDIVIFVSSLHHMAGMGIPFLFTNQHAYTVDAEFFNRETGTAADASR